VDSGKQAVVYQRYYHLFEEGELPRLVGQVEGVVLRDAFYDASNWCVVFERVA
jgi:alkylated DNA repair protein alkB family protein 8